MQAFVKEHNWLRNSASVLPYGNTEASNSPRLRVVVSLTGIASGQDHSLTPKLYEPLSGSYLYQCPAAEAAGVAEFQALSETD